MSYESFDDLVECATHDALQGIITGSRIKNIVSGVIMGSMGFGYDQANTEAEKRTILNATTGFSSQSELSTWAELHFVETIAAGKRSLATGIRDICQAASVYRFTTRKNELAATATGK